VSEQPLVSVVVPVRNEAESVERAVHSILGQDYPRERLEVVVVVGESDDDTLERARRIAAAEPRVSVIDNPAGRTPVGLNLGLRACRGRYVARLDGHAWADPRFIATAVDTLERTGADGVGGLAEHVAEGFVGQAIALAMTSRFGSGNASFRVGGGEQEADTIVFPTYRREVFERVGTYDEALSRNQDDELNHRIRLHGGRLIFAPEVRSGYVVRSSLRALWRQYTGYGQFRVVTIAKHRRPGALRQLAPPALTAGLAGAVAIEVASRGRLKTGRTALGGYAALLTAAGASVAARRRDPRLAPAVSAALATMHLAYGSGFWREAATRLVGRGS
jgi:glycosyltransferase involved in cell wall biosynthesis